MWGFHLRDEGKEHFDMEFLWWQRLLVLHSTATKYQQIFYKLDKTVSLVCSVVVVSLFFKMLKCIELDERLKAMDQEITVNPQFVQKVIDLTFCQNI